MPISIKNTATQYGLGARLLHWCSVALLVTLIVTAADFEDLDVSAEKIELIKLHASYGLLFLMVMFIRLYWRCTNINPVRSYNIQAWQKFSAQFLHWGIYFIVISQSLIGIVNLLVAGETLSFFSLFEIPALFEKNSSIFEVSGALHYMLSITIYALFAIHISAAMYHQLFGVLDDEDE